MNQTESQSMYQKLGISEELVRYHIRKLVEQGYLRALSSGYEPTGRILFINEENA